VSQFVVPNAEAYPSTVKSLTGFLPFSKQLIDRLADRQQIMASQYLQPFGHQLVVCKTSN